MWTSVNYCFKIPVRSGIKHAGMPYIKKKTNLPQHVKASATLADYGFFYINKDFPVMFFTWNIFETYF